MNLPQTGCLVTRIRPYATNPNVALVKTPKLLWMDCGLAAALAGINTPAEAKARPDAGFWLEQTLFQMLQSWRAQDPLQRKLHFWRAPPRSRSGLNPRTKRETGRPGNQGGRTVTSSDAGGIRPFRDSLKQSQSLVRSGVLHAGQGRPLNPDSLALLWGGMVAGG